MFSILKKHSEIYPLFVWFDGLWVIPQVLRFKFGQRCAAYIAVETRRIGVHCVDRIISDKRKLSYPAKLHLT